MKLKRRLFTESSDQKKIKLSDVGDHRGIGRASLLSYFDSGGSLIGGYAGKREADKADSEGLDDKKILKRSVNKAGEVGAVSGAGLGLAVAALGRRKGLKMSYLKKAVVGGGVGYLGSRSAAKANTKNRLEQRAKIGSK